MSGAAYVLWLAWKLIRAGRYDGRGEAKPATFWDGVILLILNPKAYIIMGIDVQPISVNGRGAANCECFGNFDYIHA
jgi:threonine/homoserine/homoserine lactone efflux protein